MEISFATVESKILKLLLYIYDLMIYNGSTFNTASTLPWTYKTKTNKKEKDKFFKSYLRYDVTPSHDF